MSFGVSRLASRTLLVGLALGVTACAQFLSEAPNVKVRPLAKIQGEIKPQNPEYYESAVAAIGNRDYGLALDYLQAARSKDPENVRVLNAFGVVYDKLGRFDLSARFYAQASSLDPKSSIVAKNIAYSKSLQGLTAPVASQFASSQPSSLIEAPTNGAPVTPGAKEVFKFEPALAKRVSVISGSLIPNPSVSATPPVNATATLSQSETARAKPLWNSVPMPDVRQSASTPRKPPAQSNALPAPVREMTSSVTEIHATAITSPVSTKNASTKTVLLTGYPLVVTDASGKSEAAQLVRHNLANLGWTISRDTGSSTRSQPITKLLYPPSSVAVAHALARTLPFPAQLTANSCSCGLQLVVGSDFSGWKSVQPRNSGPRASSMSVASIANKRSYGVR